MAENTILGRIQLKYDTLANWDSSTFILKQGEIAIAEVPANTSNSGLTPPAIGIKVGDGVNRFSNLPWIQAAAGDVYAWAKAANKPSYAANEISGLSDFVDGRLTNSIQYRIVQGSTAQDLNTYYLESKASNASEWTRDTTYTINLQSMDTRLSTLEEWADTDVALATQIGTILSTRLAALALNDTAVEHQFVTQVTQTNGQIAVTRSALSAEDITDGVLPVARGGTGLGTIPADSVIVGNGTGTPSTKTISSTVNDDSNLVTGAAVRSYVASQIAGFSGAMHYIGETEDEMSADFDGVPEITGKTYTTPAAGDVVSYEHSEWIYDGNSWRELGTEGDYAVKGSIAKNDLTAALQSEISGKLDSTTAANTYVAQNGTDRLMTAAEGTKLNGIETGAQVNVIESVSVNNIPLTITEKGVNIDLSNVGDVKGARVPNATTGYEDVEIDTTTKKLELARMAKTGDVADLLQTSGTVLVLNCGTATTVID